MVDKIVGVRADGGEQPTQNQEYIREVIGHQVQFVKDLNDELLRTIRLHTAIGAVMAAGLSAVGFDVLLSQGRPAYLGVPTPFYWILGAIALMVGIGIWTMHFFGYRRMEYSTLNLGITSDGNATSTDSVQEYAVENQEKITNFENEVGDRQRGLMLGLSLLVAGLMLLSM
jgi:hypothetical protein